MQGAREYAALIPTGQFGKLYCHSSSHARGSTFNIYVIPEGVVVNGRPQIPPEGVEVYGMTGGQPGWTETYGWLHEGKWQDDFESLVQTRRLEVAVEAKQTEALKLKSELEKVKTDKKILEKY